MYAQYIVVNEIIIINNLILSEPRGSNTGQYPGNVTLPRIWHGSGASRARFIALFPFLYPVRHFEMKVLDQSCREEIS
jgi:hypothetical protein